MVLSRQAGILILDNQSKQSKEQSNTEQQDLQDIILSREDGFGVALKRAREERNLSIGDVAKELHLDKKFIQAIETEDYTLLPAPAFVCGYIRNYAKLIELQPEALIADYKKGEALEPELKVSKQKRIRDFSIKSTFFLLLFKLLLLLCLVFGSWYLWLYISEHYINVSTTTNDNMELSIEAPITDSLTVFSENDSEEKLSLPVIDNYVTENTVIEVNENTIDVVDEVTTGEAATGEVATETSLPEVERSFDNVVTIVSAENSTDRISTDIDEAAELKESLNIVTNRQLMLDFSGNSWIKIKDANGKTLSSGTQKSGIVLKLEGQRPYDMTIGNAQKVKVYIDGQLFDHSAFINKNGIARFTLP